MLTTLIKGLTILEKYNKDEQAYFAAEHDEIFVGGPKPAKMEAADRHVLRDTGWRYSTDHDCWHAFV